MIISKTPFRISFVGGGTDNLLEQNFEGNVISTTINKFVYVSLNKKFDNKIRFSYSKTENVNRANQLKHEMLRETFKFFKIKNSLEITSVADIPSFGSGLGSSSSFLVGLINCINFYYKLNMSKQKIAEIACKIEINILKKPIGMQDQYIASFGGLSWINFKSKKNIKVKKINIRKEKLEEFQNNLFLVYTNQLRKSEKILKKVKKEKNLIALKELSKLSIDFKNELENGNLDSLGEILDKSWFIKKKLSSNTSNTHLNNMYKYGLSSGASGGKLLGAGGGGFMLFYVKKNNRKKFIKKFIKFNKINFEFYKEGSQVFKI